VHLEGHLEGRLEDHPENHLEDQLVNQLVDHLMSAGEAWVVLVDHWHLMLEAPMVGE